MYLITDRQVMKMNTFVFDEAEKKLRAQRVAPIIRDQSIEVGELIYKGAPPIASAQIVPTEGFIPAWLRKRIEWIRRGSPAQAITNQRPVIYPQRFDLTARERYSAPTFRPIWNVPLLATPEKPRDSWMFPQLVEVAQPLLARARETRRKVLDTFPKLKYILEGQ